MVKSPIEKAPVIQLGMATACGRADTPFWKMTLSSPETAKLVRRRLVTLAPRIGRKATRSIATAATAAQMTARSTAAGNGTPAMRAASSA